MSIPVVSRELTGRVEAIVREAGELVMEAFGGSHTFEDKADGSFVTNVDKASEKLLIEALTQLIPQAGFIAEESGTSVTDAHGYNWIIDPIDGTTNFAHGFPYFGINVALVHDGNPQIGVTYDPYAGELFSAYRGGGATLNGKPIEVAHQDDPQRALVSLAAPCRRSDCADFYAITKTLQDNVYTIRKLGSACLDLAYVAAGRLDAAVLKYVSWWDIAAGIVLVEEAAGSVGEFNKTTIGEDFTTCLAANSNLIGKLRHFLG